MIVTIFLGDDWQGLYIDGELQQQGHRLDLIRVLHNLKNHGGESITTIEEVEEKGDWLMYEGYLPETTKELFEKNKE